MKINKHIIFLFVLFLVVSCSNADNNDLEIDKPSGKIINGVRTIKIGNELSFININIYRGETVTLVFEQRPYDFSVHIPEYSISKDIGKNEKRAVDFKAKKTGVYPIFCNGNCPKGNGVQAGKIVVMEFEEIQELSFKVVSAKEAKKMLSNKNVLLLDVRTPFEFYNGHIPGAKLIPLQQLEDRIYEIEEYKDKDLIVYCRSGNRSIVAAEILISHKFNKLYHIKNGILEWQNEGFKIK